MADGGVRLDVRFNISKAEKEIAKLSKEFDEMNQQLDESKTRKSDLESKLERIAEESKKVQEESDKAYKKVQELTEAREENFQKNKELALKYAVKAETATNEADRIEAEKKSDFWISAANSAWDKDTEAIEKAEQELSAYVSKLEKLDQQRISAEETINPLIAKEEEEQAVLNQKLEEKKNKIGGLIKKVEEYKLALAEQKAKQDEAWKNLPNSIEEAKNKMMKFVKYAVGIRSLYVLFRKLKNSIKESVMAFAERDSETQNNINNLKASLEALKVSWGAAFAPILNAVMPLLQKLIGWLNTAANAIAAFFAALTGKSTFKKGVANAEALNKNLGGAAENAKETKKQLAGFDELNILQNNDANGGGGGGSAAADLEEVEINPKLLKAVSWIQDHLGLIKNLAEAIGFSFLTWKISSKLGNSLVQTAELAAAIFGIAMFVFGAFDAWENGVNWLNLTEMIGGLTVAAIALGLAFGVPYAAVVLLIGGIAMLVIGIKDWIETGELTGPVFTLIVSGIMAIGAAVSLLTGSWIPLAIAAVVAFVFAVGNYADAIKEKVGNIYDSISNFLRENFGLLGEPLATLVDIWKNDFFIMIDVAKFAYDVIKAIFITLVEFVKGIITGDMESAFDHIGEAWKSVWDGLKKSASEKWEAIKDAITGPMEEAKETIHSIIEKIKSFFNFEFTWPHIKLPHINYDLINVPLLGSIPNPATLRVDWYAKGGIFDSASIIGVGEKGTEAVLPLENNTEWLTKIADMLAYRLSANSFADQLANAMSNVTYPAIASGMVIPPNSTVGYSLTSILRTLNDIRNMFSGRSGYSGESETINLQIDLDGSTVARKIYKHTKRIDVERGESLVNS